MRVSIFGIGYVGCVTAACLANRKHCVFAVDADPEKLKRIRRGVSTVLEPGLQEFVAEAVRRKRLQVTTDPKVAVANSDVSMICVGTPLRENGSIDLTHLETVCREIGTALRTKKSRHLVVVRSTSTPGTAEELVIPTLERFSQRRTGEAFGVCVNPEFLREGTSVQDFHHPPFTLIGEHSPEDGEQLGRFYRFLKAPVIRTSLRVAEAVKMVSNSFHGLKIGFANEIGNICQTLGIDSHEVMDIFCRDRVLNISPSYLKPGFAFGGSCLPKDLQALLYEAKRHDVEAPILRSILPSNQLQVHKALDMILATGRKRIGIVGLSFKEGTDDLRLSPMVQLVELLIGKGYQLKIYDPNVHLARIFGSNRSYIQKEIPHISSLLLSSFASLCRFAEVIVLGQRNAAWAKHVADIRRDQIIIDLVRIKERNGLNGSYRGICW
jgi:GDP-mannose 6-dehydrogenase